MLPDLNFLRRNAAKIAAPHPHNENLHSIPAIPADPDSDPARPPLTVIQDAIPRLKPDKPPPKLPTAIPGLSALFRTPEKPAGRSRQILYHGSPYWSRLVPPQGSPKLHCARVVSATTAPAATHRSAFTSLWCTAPAACCVVPSPPCFLLFSNYLFRKHQFRSREDGMEDELRAMGDEIASLEDESRTGVQALTECLTFVDLIQRLRIQRNFEEYIKKIMETTYIINNDDIMRPHCLACHTPVLRKAHVLCRG